MSFSDWGGSSGTSGYQDSNPFGASAPARGNSLRHDDKDSQFQIGLHQVTEDIRQMTANFGTITSLTKSLGTGQDNAKLRDTLQQKIKSNYNLVKQVQSSIRDLHGLASSSAEKKGKIEKLSLDFENFNTKFKQLASVATERMEDMPVSTRIDIDDRSGYAVSDPSSYRASMESDDDRTRLLGQQQQYMRLEADREFQDSLIRQRDLEIRSIQGQMIEVNEIFKDLAKLVDDQAVAVDNIETNIVSAAENVKVAKEDLTKAEDTQVSSRKKLIGFAIFILIMVIVIVLVVVFTLRNKDS